MIPGQLEIRSADTRAILEALPEDVIRRMRNWVRWDGGRGIQASSGSSSFMLDYGTGYQHSYREATFPLFVAEAEQTQDALLSIEGKYGTAVALFWKCGEEASFREMGTHLGCNHETCRARIIRGHELLTVEFYRRQSERPDLVLLDRTNPPD